MQVKLIVVLAFGFIYNMAWACDLCTVYLGIRPNDFKNSFSLRYRYRLFERDFISSSSISEHSPTIGQSTKTKNINKHGAASEVAPGTRYNIAEAYNSYELINNVFLSQKLELMSSISFSDNYVVQDDSIIDNIGGIGDLNLLLKFIVFNSVKKEDSTTTSKNLIHRMKLGNGIIIPTGNYNKTSIVGFNTEFEPNTIIGEPEMELDPYLQAGTGSFGYLFLMEYLIRMKSLGLNLNGSYRINATNKNQFRLANRFNFNGAMFYLTKLSDNFKVMPTIGFSYEHSGYDNLENIPWVDSGGKTTFMNYGLNIYIHKIGIEFTYYDPLMDRLNGIQPYNNKRIVSQVTFYF